MTANTQRSPRLLLFSLGAIALLAAGIAGGYFLLPNIVGGAADAEHDHAGETVYFCPMHPQIRQPEPGICPICNMDLVPENSPDAMASHSGEDDHGEMIHVTPRERVIAAVKTVEVGYEPLSSTITAPATVAINESTHKAVTAWYPGRIERLYVNKTGQYVRKGEAIADVYSPQLTTAQKEYLIALEAKNQQLLPSIERTGEEKPEGKSRGDQLVRASRQRLKLLGMSEEEITALEKRGEVTWTTTIRSTASGIVTTRGVTEGAYVNEGTMLAEVVDLSSVWVMVNVYENDANNVARGMNVQVTGPPLNGKNLHGVIDYVYPSVDPESRTVQVRALFSNPGTQLKPGMYLTATILKPTQNTLTVPASAVIRTGKRNIVYIEVEENMFEPRDVQLGIKADGYYQITGGNLKTGDRVVSEGGYLLDSERQLSGEVSGGHGH